MLCDPSILVSALEAEVVNMKEEMTKQLQEAEMVLEAEKQKLLKVRLSAEMPFDQKFWSNGWSNGISDYQYNLYHILYCFAHTIAIIQELSRGKTEALKLMDEDMDLRLEELKREKDTHWEAILAKK